MTVSILRSHFKKAKPKTVTYRCYKKYDDTAFREELDSKLLQVEPLNSENFEEVYLSVLEVHAPSKEKLIRANESPFMTKEVKKAFMNITRLKNRYLKDNTPKNKDNYKKVGITV